MMIVCDVSVMMPDDVYQQNPDVALAFLEEHGLI
jgi:hypothetical protein